MNSTDQPNPTSATTKEMYAWAWACACGFLACLAGYFLLGAGRYSEFAMALLILSVPLGLAALILFSLLDPEIPEAKRKVKPPALRPTPVIKSGLLAGIVTVVVVAVASFFLLVLAIYTRSADALMIFFWIFLLTGSASAILIFEEQQAAARKRKAQRLQEQQQQADAHFVGLLQQAFTGAKVVHEIHQPRPFNCHSCAAPLPAHGPCEYCGTYV